MNRSSAIGTPEEGAQGTDQSLLTFSPLPHLQGARELVGAIQRLSLARSLEEIQEIVRTSARRLSGADGATFILRDGDQCHYVDEDAISPLWKGRRFPMSACISGWAMLNHEPAVIEDIYADDRIPHEAYRTTFVKSLAMVPIRTLDPIGAIGNYWAERHRPTEQEVELLQALADSTAVAMESVASYSALEQARRETLERLAIAAEFRDDDTFEHTRRVARTATRIAEHLSASSGWIELLGQAAPLHDVGKLAVSDTILLKPGKLTMEEFEEIKRHPVAGATILSGSGSDVLALAEEIALSHHEWWDGSGYPNGLAEQGIPLSGRIVAVADVYDALTNTRPYKDAWPHERAVEEIRRLSGAQFDPAVVTAFEAVEQTLAPA